MNAIGRRTFGFRDVRFRNHRRIRVLPIAHRRAIAHFAKFLADDRIRPPLSAVAALDRIPDPDVGTNASTFSGLSSLFSTGSVCDVRALFNRRLRSPD